MFGDHRLGRGEAFADPVPHPFVAFGLRHAPFLFEVLQHAQVVEGMDVAGHQLGQRAHALAQLVACDVHPLNNLRVLQYFEHEWNVPQPERDEWVRHWIVEGFRASEAMLADHLSTGIFCDGDVPGLADCCLVPQVYNARRFGVDMARFPTLQRIEAACLELPAFDAARPERQPDAPEKNR